MILLRKIMGYIMQKIPVFFSFDNSYSAQCGVTLYSLLYTAHKSVFYELYIISDDISEENKKKLHDIADNFKNCSLHIFSLKDRIKIDFHEKFTRQIDDLILTREGLYRCIAMLIDEFNQYDKIIYSDVDIVVMRDISALYDIELNDDTYLAAFRHPKFMENLITHIPEKIRENYFGVGLLVMNLKKMREDNFADKVMEIMNDKSLTLTWNEQDIMNIACDGKYINFSYEYVSIPTWKSYLKQKNYYDDYYPNGELEDAMMRPAIVHYAGQKPWVAHNPPIPQYDLWFYYLKKTPFKDDYKKEEENVKKIENLYTIKLFSFIPVGKMKINGAVNNKIYIKIFKFLRILKLEAVEK